MSDVMQDGSLDAAVAGMPDIEELERANGVAFEQQAAGEAPKADAPPTDTRTRDEAGKFKAKDPEPAAKPEADAKAAEPKAEAPVESDDDDPLVEFGAEEGKEPVREKLSKVWDGYQRASQLEKDLEAAKGAVRTLEPAEVTVRMHEVAAKLNEAVAYGEQLRASLHVGEPDRQMLNPGSPTYDPTGYYEQLQRADAVKAYAANLDREIADKKNQASEVQRAADAQHIAREQVALLKGWPELSSESVAQSVKAEAAKHWGIDEATITRITDHRILLMAKDALAYRSAKAIEAKAVTKVSAKPKLVPSAARSSQTGNQRNAADARARLAQSGSIEDAVAALDGLF